MCFLLILSVGGSVDSNLEALRPAFCVHVSAGTFQRVFLRKKNVFSCMQKCIYVESWNLLGRC